MRFIVIFPVLSMCHREIFNTDLALAIQDILMQTFHGIESTFTTYFSDSVLARIHFLIRVNPKTKLDYSVAEIESKLIAVARSWFDELKDQLITYYGEAEGLKYFSKYCKAFPASYSEDYTAKEALEDIEKIETLSSDNPLACFSPKQIMRIH